MRYDEMWAFSEHMFEQTSIAYVVSLRSNPRAARRGRSGRASIELGKKSAVAFDFQRAVSESSRSVRPEVGSDDEALRCVWKGPACLFLSRRSSP